MRKLCVFVLLSIGLAPATAIARPNPAPAPRPAASRFKYLAPYQVGIASWYGPDFHGKETSNGEHFNMFALTAAHPSLPFGARVRVTNLLNGRTVVLRINDRGPVVAGRVIDLSRAAARAVGFVEDGLIPVRLDLVR